MNGFTLNDKEETKHVLFANDKNHYFKIPYLNVKCKKSDGKRECNLVWIGKDISIDLKKKIPKS